MQGGCRYIVKEASFFLRFEIISLARRVRVNPGKKRKKKKRFDFQ
jgi:hypothetical protein